MSSVSGFLASIDLGVNSAVKVLAHAIFLGDIQKILLFDYLLSSNTTNMIVVALIITEYVATIEHYNPGAVRMFSECC